MGITVEADDELHRAMTCAATAAYAGNFRFPIGLLVVEPAQSLAAFRDGGPWFISARRVRDQASGRNGYLAMLRRLSLGHAEAAGLLRCRREIVQSLSTGLCRRKGNAPQGREKYGG